MALVSQAMRSSAILHLFSLIHFACAEDFAFWFDMVRRTPNLLSVVNKVKFSQPDKRWLARHRSFIRPSTPLRGATIPPILPLMPTVKVVEWFDPKNDIFSELKMVVAYMALFPNLTTLCLRYSYFESVHALSRFLDACGGFRVLWLEQTQVEEFNFGSDDSDSDSDVPLQARGVDLARLEELHVLSNNRAEEFLVRLIEQSPPIGLKSLTFGSFSHIPEHENVPCSAPAMEKLLRLAAVSLVHLAIHPTFPTASRE
jgi:hypothetical protein